MKILVTGFEPFDGLDINPSAQLLDFLKTKEYDFELKTKLLPVSFDNAFLALKEEIKTFAPHKIVLTGLANRRNELSIEKIAINYVNSRNTDNDGNRPKKMSINESMPDGLFATLPVESIVDYCITNNLPANMSYTAGTYVCNDLFFKALVYLKDTKIQVGFIHLPSTEEIAPAPHYLEKEKLFSTFDKILKNAIA